MRQSQPQLTDKWTTIRGLPLHYRVSIEPLPANATSIVLVHGLGVCGHYMLPTAYRLAPYYRVYVPDLPGFGKSAKPPDVLNMIELSDVLAAWMQAIGLQRAVLLGNSLGCQVIAHLALRHPEHIQRAILTSPTMDPRAPTIPHVIRRALLDIPFERLSLYPILLHDYLDAGIRRSLDTFHYALQDHIEHQLPHLQIPTLVVRGSRDPVVPQHWAEAVTRLLPHGQLVVIRGAGHGINHNSPATLAKAVRVFLTQHFPDASSLPAKPDHPQGVALRGPALIIFNHLRW
ncbi:MAG TPA: alpha/beta hydrolase [Ktedonobacteraceae bacterium]|nr:alpha/beta hydrolase [Ktedonobacteraceae bacterium]